jgi:hypothetical protein
MERGFSSLDNMLKKLKRSPDTLGSVPVVVCASAGIVARNSLPPPPNVQTHTCTWMSVVFLAIIRVIGSRTNPFGFVVVVHLQNVLHMARDILSGLHYMHEKHVVHFDLKPGNVRPSAAVLAPSFMNQLTCTCP